MTVQLAIYYYNDTMEQTAFWRWILMFWQGARATGLKLAS
jgi:hypothetical protein